MKNKEKFAKQILTFACKFESFGVDEETREVEECTHIICSKCKFYARDKTCEEHRREWAESEYIEKPVISKKDRVFLEYLENEIKYIARDKCGVLMAYDHVSEKSEDGWRIDVDCIYMKSLCRLKVQFPMVKWEDDEPWMIEDLKKLEVVEDYE